MKTVGGQDHFKRWDSKILEIELEYLSKEIEHLQRKNQERDLTEWENERVLSIEKERKRISYRISSASFDRSRFEGL